MDDFFQGKRVIVTGAGRGIGRAISKELALKGASVIAISRSKEHLESLKQEVPNIEIIPLDIGDWSKTASVVESIGPVHMLVNNAGVAFLHEFGKITEDEFDKSFSVNVKAALNISQVVVNGMKENNIRGSIVNMSSQASLVALENHSVYCATKGALDLLTKVMALELGPHGIRVNSVNPTVVLTDMAKEAWGEEKVANAMKAKIPLREFCVPEDVVKATVFLLSDASQMITGAQLPIDGGYTIH